MAIAPTIQKPNHLKSGHFCMDFKWFLTKRRSFVHFSKGWGSGFQTSFKIRIICNPTSFRPFEIQTSPDFRSPVYVGDPRKREMEEWAINKLASLLACGGLYTPWEGFCASPFLFIQIPLVYKVNSKAPE